MEKRDWLQKTDAPSREKEKYSLAIDRTNAFNPSKIPELRDFRVTEQDSRSFEITQLNMMDVASVRSVIEPLAEDIKPADVAASPLDQYGRL